MIDLFWDASHALYKHGLRKPARVFEVLSMIVSSHAVSAEIEIGANSKFWHHGLGCVALQSVHIGNNCKIFQNVTFGNRFSEHPQDSMGGGTGHCSVGDNCMIGAGAVILGNVTIGNNVSVGANAVVTRDIPDNCVAVGVPAIIRRKDS